jgi:hypothetical protein
LHGDLAVAGLVGDDAQQPGPERRALAKSAQGSVGLEEPILRGLLGIGAERVISQATRKAVA